MCETKSVTSSLYLDMNENLPDVTVEEKQVDKYNQMLKKGQISEGEYNTEVTALKKIIETGHDYRFIGKVGNFCPILPGKGGGLLVREKDGKYYAATGSKGYRWLESEMIRGTNEAFIDRRYYDELVNEAIKTIEQYGDFEMFVTDTNE